MEVDPTVLFDEDTEIVGVSCGRSHTAYLTSGCSSIFNTLYNLYIYTLFNLYIYTLYNL